MSGDRCQVLGGRAAGADTESHLRWEMVGNDPKMRYALPFAPDAGQARELLSRTWRKHEYNPMVSEICWPRPITQGSHELYGKSIHQIA